MSYIKLVNFSWYDKSFIKLPATRSPRPTSIESVATSYDREVAKLSPAHQDFLLKVSQF